MGFLDTFKGKQYKQQSENLQAELDRLKSTFTPEMRNASELMKLTDKLNNEIRSLNQTISDRNETISSLDSQISSLNGAIKYRQDEIINLDEQMEMQSFGCTLLNMILLLPIYTKTGSRKFAINKKPS